jgi:formylglycine-generating enzyme required for sulfatase activity
LSGVPCRDGQHRRTAPVGAYEANAFGLSDMAGNVWEWVSGCADGAAEPTGPGQSCQRVLRGGSWESGPSGLTPEARRTAPGGLRGNTIGFRVALDWPS